MKRNLTLDKYLFLRYVLYLSRTQFDLRNTVGRNSCLVLLRLEDFLQLAEFVFKYFGNSQRSFASFAKFFQKLLFTI